LVLLEKTNKNNINDCNELNAKSFKLVFSCFAKTQAQLVDISKMLTGHLANVNGNVLRHIAKTDLNDILSETKDIY